MRRSVEVLMAGRVWRRKNACRAKFLFDIWISNNYIENLEIPAWIPGTVNPK